MRATPLIFRLNKKAVRDGSWLGYAVLYKRKFKNNHNEQVVKGRRKYDITVNR